MKYAQTNALKLQLRSRQLHTTPDSQEEAKGCFPSLKSPNYLLPKDSASNYKNEKQR
jgi:hypothetical protein